MDSLQPMAEKYFTVEWVDDHTDDDGTRWGKPSISQAPAVGTLIPGTDTLTACAKYTYLDNPDDIYRIGATVLVDGEQTLAPRTRVLEPPAREAMQQTIPYSFGKQLLVKDSYIRETEFDEVRAYEGVLELVSVVYVTFDANGGTADAPAPIASWNGGSVTLPAYSGTRAGFSFDGWNANNNGSGDNADAGATYSVTGSSNINLYARWKRVFNCLTGDATTGTVVQYAFWLADDFTSTLTFPANSGSAKSGWDPVSGWFAAGDVDGQGPVFASGETKALRNDAYDSDTINLYAVASSTSSFVPGAKATSDAASATQYYNSDGTYSTPSVPSLTSNDSLWTVDGWKDSTEATQGVAFASGEAASSSKSLANKGTYYALSHRNVRVEFSAGDATSGSVPDSVFGAQYYNASGTVGSTSVELPGNPGGLSKEKYKFAGWQIGGAAATSYTWDDADDDAVVIASPLWTRDPSTLTSVTVTASDASGTYGDDPSSKFGYSVSSGSLLPGDSIESVTYACDASPSSPAGQSFEVRPTSVVITDAGGNDVTAYYDVSFASGTYTVGQREVALDWDEKSLSFVFDGTEHAPLASVENAVSGDELTVVVGGGQTDVGTYDARALSVVGDRAGNYVLPDDAAARTQSFSIVQREVALVWPTSNSLAYTGSPQSFVALSVDSGIAGQVLEVTGYKGEGASIAQATEAGDYESVPLGLRAADGYEATTKPSNYCLPTNPGHAWSIVAAANSASISVDGWTYGSRAGSQPRVRADFGSASATVSYFTDATCATPVASSQLDADGMPTQAGHYWAKVQVPATSSFASAEATCEFEVSKAPIQVRASDRTTKRTEAQATLGIEVSGQVATSLGETAESLAGNLVGTYVDISCPDLDVNRAGRYPIQVTWHEGVSSHPNYDITFVGGTYTVTRSSATVQASGWSGVYDGTDTGKLVTVTASLDGGGSDEGHSGLVSVYYSDEDFSTLLSGRGVSLDTLATADTGSEEFSAAWAALGEALSSALDQRIVSTSSPRFTHAGTHTVYFLVVSDQVTPDVIVGSQDVVVTPAPLSVVARDKAIAYGDEPSGDGVNYQGLCGDDTPDVLTGELALSFGYELYGNVGDYEIVPSGLRSDDYDVRFVPGTLTVSPRTLALSWPEGDRLTYNGGEQSCGAPSLSGIVNGDDVSVGVVDGTSGVHGGSYVARVRSLAGADAANYALPSDPTHPWSIATASNSASVSLDGWTYGEAPAAPVCTVDFGSQTATFAFADAEEGPYDVDVPVAAGSYWVRATIVGNEDYEPAIASSRFEIARRPAVVTASDQVVEVGASIAQDVSKAKLAGGASSDSLVEVTLSSSPTSERTADGSITATDAKVQGSGGTDVTSNYALSYKPGKLIVCDHVLVADDQEDPSAPGKGTHAVVYSNDFSVQPGTVLSEADVLRLAGAGALDSSTGGAVGLTVDTSQVDTTAFGTYPVVVVAEGGATLTLTCRVTTQSGKNAAEDPEPWTDDTATPPVERLLRLSADDFVLSQAEVQSASAAGLAALVTERSHVRAYDALSGQERPQDVHLDLTDSGLVAGTMPSLGIHSPRFHTGHGAEVLPNATVVAQMASEDGKVIYAQRGRVPLSVDEVQALLDAPDCDAQLVELAGVVALEEGGEPTSVSVVSRGGMAAERGTYRIVFGPNPSVAVDFEVSDHLYRDPDTGVVVVANDFDADPAVVRRAKEGDEAAERELADAAGAMAFDADGNAVPLDSLDLTDVDASRTGTYPIRFVGPGGASVEASVSIVVVVPDATMHRLYNPYSGEHFYTASTSERDAVVAAGWNYEGVGWVAPGVSDAPVYRLYNAYAGDHHYTASAAERNWLVDAGWTYEGIGWYSAPSDGVAVWREYNPNARAGAHNFTTSQEEHMTLMRLGWLGEGIAWYAVR